MSIRNPRRAAAALVLIYPFWLGMMLVHELGHVIGAMLTGGTVVNVVIPLVGFSRTDVDPNPSPLIVAWAGPIAGVLLPLLLIAVPAPRPVRKVFRAFAGWCLVANGAYLAVGWLDRVGDAGDLVRLGTPIPILIVIGAAFLATGVYLWHRLGITSAVPAVTEPSPPPP